MGDRWVLALLVGSGGGWSRGSGEATGYAIAGSKLGWSTLGHLAPQIGYLVTRHLLLSAWGRFQLVRGADAYATPSGSLQCGGDGRCNAATGAFAGGISAAWLFGSRDSAVRPYVALSAGAGYARQVVKIDATATDCGSDRQLSTCRDTAAVGPALGGPALGMHVRLSRSTRLVLSIQSLFGAPKFTVDIDANVGLALVL